MDNLGNYIMNERIFLFIKGTSSVTTEGWGHFNSFTAGRKIWVIAVDSCVSAGCSELVQRGLNKPLIL